MSSETTRHWDGCRAAVPLIAACAIHAAARADAASNLVATNNQETSIVYNVLADQSIEEAAEAAGQFYAQGSNAARWLPFTVVASPDAAEFSSTQLNLGYATDPNQNGSRASAFFGNLAATLIQVQSPSPIVVGGSAGVPQFIFTDLGTARTYAGNPSATDKYANKAEAVIKKRWTYVTPSLLALWTYSHGATGDSKPEIRATETLLPAHNRLGDWALQFAVFEDRLVDLKPVSGNLPPDSGDSNQWSAGTTITVLEGPNAYQGIGDWRLDDALAYVNSFAETAGQSYHQVQDIVTLRTPPLMGMSALLAFEYDHSVYRAVLPYATSVKRSYSATLDYKLPSPLFGKGNEEHVLLGIDPVLQGVNNPDPAIRKIGGFDDNEFFVAFEILNGSANYNRTPGAGRYRERL